MLRVLLNRLTDQIVYRPQQRLSTNRLGYVGVHPGGIAPQFITFQGVRRHGNDRNVFTRDPLAFTDTLCCLYTVHYGYFQIHYDDIESFQRKRVNCFTSISRERPDGPAAPARE
jgi:hypothetical protein